MGNTFMQIRELCHSFNVTPHIFSHVSGMYINIYAYIYIYSNAEVCCSSVYTLNLGYQYPMFGELYCTLISQIIISHWKLRFHSLVIFQVNFLRNGNIKI